MSQMRMTAFTVVVVTFAVSTVAWAQTYTQVDYPGALASYLNGGPNPRGVSVGTYVDTGHVSHGFTYYNGAYTSFDPTGSTGTYPVWISPQGTITGYYSDASGITHGFILSRGQYTTVDYPGAAYTGFEGMNPSGDIVGFYCTDKACANQHSFILSDGQFTSFDPPGALTSLAGTVNPSGAICGYFNTPSHPAVLQGYLLYKGNFTTISFPTPGNWTYCGANNPQGDIIGGYVDMKGVEHGYFVSNGVFTSFDVPGSILTAPGGLNPSGVIVGHYLDSASKEHGFVRTP